MIARKGFVLPARIKSDLTEEDLVALTAACAPATAGAFAWNGLLANTRFDELGDNSQRLVPAIYRNLRSKPSLQERDRMRGAFKHHWSKNTRLLFECGSVIRDLNAQGIPYRILKGAAVQTVVGSIGSRVMGDLDLLIHAADARQVEQVMASHGFRRSSHSPCQTHTEDNLAGAIDFNRGEVHVDVHLAGIKYPRQLLLRMLRQPGLVIAGPCGDMHLPEPELLLLHACVHGGLAAGSTDLVQALLDASMLNPMVQPTVLERLASSTNTIDELESVDHVLEAIGLSTSGASFGAGARIRHMSRRTIDEVPRMLSSAGSIGRRLHQRQRGTEALRRALRSFPGHKRAYAAWIASGQFAVGERAAVRRWGGFLAPPSALAPSVFHPFAHKSGSVVASDIAPASLDWRFRIAMEGSSRRRWLEFDDPAFETMDAFVFVNGVPTSRIVAGDQSSRIVGIFNVETSVEVSLRPLWRACPLCFGGLNDMRVAIIT